MTQIEQTQQAKDFAEYWQDKGDEKQETQRYWIELLQEVLGIENPSRYIEFEKRVKLTHTSFIDAYISSTKVLIEQKGAKVDLTKPQEQSDGAMLTPYQQAKRYADELSYDLKPRWIVVSNFKEIHVHDMNNLHAEPEIIKLENLEKEYYRLQFLVDTKNENIRREEEISLQAGILVGKLYDALIKEYINPDESSLRSLNILCVRLVFCFYAEDAGLFETRTSFEDYIKSFNLPNLRKAMIDLFKGLDTKLEKRDKYDTSLKAFPYVNGGLFAAEDIEIPNFTQEIVDVLVNDCAPFDWREISPTIFGAVFESTLNPETRRTGGMHYTSIENIHKVIDPLFMDELEAEFEAIASTGSATSSKARSLSGVEGKKLSPKQRIEALHAFQEKLGNLKFLDPACGSGNFLTETYLSIRRLENKVISVLNNGEKVLGFDEFIKVKINQFYGIEINDFAVTVAKTSLWIAESQMMTETEKIIGMNLDFLPLTTNAFIVEGNALRMNWETFEVLPESKNVIFADKTNIYKIDSDYTTVISEPTVKYGEVNIVTKEVEFKNVEELQTQKTISVTYDYIMGNPPFVGKKEQSKRQKEDMDLVFREENNKGLGILDYVCSWYYKATKIIQNKKTRCAFVSTNSITQGEQATVL
jgi:type I restriction-modification system DNA methylase subunit